MYSRNFLYSDSGVDIEKGDDFVSLIKPLAEKTFRKGVINSIGGFGALFEISKKYKNPVLVSSTDGVGTKLKLAFSLNKHNLIGQDLVAMSVNDILTQGAEPLFFLDYFACNKLNFNIAKKVLNGIIYGCKIARCALIGGETAEMPGMYLPGEYDIVGFALGIIEKDKIIDGSQINAGDSIIGISSSGIHSNGFSLIREIIKYKKINISMININHEPLINILMTPTKIYSKLLLKLKKKITLKGLAHITGGGLIKNIPRILKNNLVAEIYRNSWPLFPIYEWIQKQGNINDLEMYKVFNCGIGMIVIVSEKDSSNIINIIASSGEKAWKIGFIRKRLNNENQVLIN